MRNKQTGCDVSRDVYITSIYYISSVKLTNICYLNVQGLASFTITVYPVQEGGEIKLALLPSNKPSPASALPPLRPRPLVRKQIEPRDAVREREKGEKKPLKTNCHFFLLNVTQ